MALLGALVCTGCIFGGGEQISDAPDDGSPVMDAAGGTDVRRADSSMPADMTVEPPDAGSPVDSAVPGDVSRPEDMRPPRDGGPGDWHLPAFKQRMHVEWDRQGNSVDGFVVPFNDPDPSSPVAVVDSEDRLLPWRRADERIWARLEMFRPSSEAWIYFDPDGGAPASPGDPWASPNLLGVWHLAAAATGGASELDASPAGNPLTFDVGSAPGVIGGGVTMPVGVNPHSDPGVVRNTFVAFPTPGTVEMWVKVADPTGQTLSNYLFGPVNGSGDHWKLQFGDPGASKVYLRLNRAAAEPQMDNAPFPLLDDFHYVVVVITDTEAILYINAIEQLRMDATLFNASQPIQFGGRWVNGGVLDELRLTDFGRSPAYIQAVYEAYRHGDFTYTLQRR